MSKHNERAITILWERSCEVYKRPTGGNGYLSISDSTLTSCQKGSYLHIISPIIE